MAAAAGGFVLYFGISSAQKGRDGYGAIRKTGPLPALQRGNEYEVLFCARQRDAEEMVVYRALYGERGSVRPGRYVE